jgi:hypothetical protein
MRDKFKKIIKNLYIIFISTFVGFIVLIKIIEYMLG